ncbi:MAG: fimbrillin family protein [Bacteroidales bacterium]|nr:fimbrillin family protein [Candidatus Cacconaster equi]
MKKSIFLVLILSVTACIPDKEILPGAGEDGCLYVSVDSSFLNLETKASPVTSVFEMYDTFELFEHIYTGEQPGRPVHSREIMTREGTSSVWKSASSDFMPVSLAQKTLYWAVAPANAEGISYVFPDDDQTPSVKYVVPESVSSQCDIMAALCGPNQGRPSTLNMRFSHILAGVQFKVGSVASEYSKIMDVSSVVFKNIYTSGEFRPNSDGINVYGHWTNLGSKGSRTLTRQMSYERSTSGTIYGGAYTMMLLPQTCPSDAVIDVTLSDGKHLTTSLSGVTLSQGKLNVFTFDRLMKIVFSGDSSIDVSQSKQYCADFGYSDGTMEYDIKDGVSFFSSNPDIAYFTGSTLTGKSPGNVKVYARKGDLKSNEVVVTVSPYVLKFSVGGYPDEGTSTILNEPKIFYGETLYSEVYSGNTPLKRLKGSASHDVQGTDKDVLLGSIGLVSEIQPYGLDALSVYGMRRYKRQCTVNTLYSGETDRKPGFEVFYNDDTSKKFINGGCDWWYYKDTRIEAGNEYWGRTVAGDSYSVVVTLPVRIDRQVVNTQDRYYNYVH